MASQAKHPMGGAHSRWNRLLRFRPQFENRHLSTFHEHLLSALDKKKYSSSTSRSHREKKERLATARIQARKQAEAFYFEGKFDEARQVYELILNEQKSTPERLEDPHDLMGLGMTLMEMNEFAKAEKHLRKTVMNIEQLWGNDVQEHCEVLIALSKALVSQKNFTEETEAIIDQAFERCNHIFGGNDHRTIYCEYLLVRVTWETGDLNKATKCIEHAVAGQKHLAGEEDRDTLWLEELQSRILLESGQYKKNIELFKRLVRLREKNTQDPNHVDVHASRYLLGRALYGTRQYAEAEAILCHTVQMNVDSSPDDVDDHLYAQHFLGCALYKLGSFEQAEEAFQSLRKSQQRHGRDSHIGTYDTARWLGKTLEILGKSAEASICLRQAIDGLITAKARRLSIFIAQVFLARTSYSLGRYQEAERLMLPTLKRFAKRYPSYRETCLFQLWAGDLCRRLGDNPRAMSFYQAASDGKIARVKADAYAGLANVLFTSSDEGAALAMLINAIDEYENAIGSNHPTTIRTKYQLAQCFRDIGDSQKANKYLREAAQENIETSDLFSLQSRLELGHLLMSQHHFTEAKRLLQQAARGPDEDGKRVAESLRLLQEIDGSQRVEVTKKADRDTRNEAGEGISDMMHKAQIKSTLTSSSGFTRYSNYSASQTPPESLRRLRLQESERSNPSGQSDDRFARPLIKSSEGLNITFEAVEEATGVPVDTSPNISTAAVTHSHLAKRDPSSQLDRFFPSTRSDRDLFTDAEIQEISSLLREVNQKWSRVPRTFIVLRMMGCHGLLNRFIDQGFSDHWFPVTEKGLPPCLLPSQRSQFVTFQDLVLTKSLNLTRGQNGHHCHFKHGETLPFEVKSHLGSGGFGRVDRILSLTNYEEYARKLVLRSTVLRGRSHRCVRQMIAEIEALKRIERHEHVVEFIGSYTDARYIGLIMWPVADMDLSAYLAQSSVNPVELRTFFGCLARALEFLHLQRIRHKDIKPANILIRQSTVLFTDFGLSFDFDNAEGSTTVSMVNGMTPRYCAPEVAAMDPRGTSSDIWSLGIVFLEMVAVLKGWLVSDLYQSFQECGSHHEYIRMNLEGLDEVVAKLKQSGSAVDDRPLAWIQQMLQLAPRSRLTAATLIETITTTERGDTNRFCGICCEDIDDGASDVLSDIFA